MVTPTEKGISQALKRWSRLREEKERIEAERDRAIEPHWARFEQRCAPLRAAAQAELDSVEQQIRETEAEITAAMKAGINERGDIKFTRVSTATAVAEVITRVEREIDSKAFFESVPEASRGEAFWSCLKPLIGKAEKFLGADRVNQFAHAKRTHTVSITKG